VAYPALRRPNPREKRTARGPRYVLGYPVAVPLRGTRLLAASSQKAR